MFYSVNAALHSRASSDNDARSDEAVSVKPPTLPPPPYFLTSYTVSLSGLPAAIKDSVKSALVAAHVDFEFNEAKWKAKCYVYRHSGCAVFSVRLYTKEGSDGENGYIVELQRRKVSCFWCWDECSELNITLRKFLSAPPFLPLAFFFSG